ncbi:hypothetical protein T12_3349 [Trichinella patagoniensis]|uniref:Uncharacterized protein n=1 Tax=Trichinella patagoniensis TaxID=990121 RepID=A0A0V1AFX5_9BILA|nr:hypothetical protein T12_3349 [Trichinella patagoniensis]
MCLKERNGVTAYLWIESKNHVLMISVATKTQFRKGLVVVDTATCWCDSQMATLRSKSSSSTFLCNGHRHRHYDRLRAFGRKSRILKEPRVLEKRSLERNHEGYLSRIIYNNSHDERLNRFHDSLLQICPKLSWRGRADMHRFLVDLVTMKSNESAYVFVSIH